MTRGEHLAQADWWQAVLESIAATIVALDVSGYRLTSSDGWQRTSMLEQVRRHLDFWAEIGGALQWDRACYTAQIRVHLTLSQQPDTDNRSQAVVLAAVFDVAEAMTRWGLNGARTEPIRIEVQDTADPEFVAAIVTANLYIPRQ